MNKQTISIIGAGNIASSLLGGLLINGYDPKSLWATNPSIEKLSELQQRLGIQITTDNSKGAQQADILVLAVKPQMLKSVAHELAPIIAQRKPLIISVVAGIQEQQIRQWIQQDQAPIVRCMPNTPALIGSGATGLYANPWVSAEQKDQAESILRAVGIIVWLENETQIDAVTALSGCGPAYFFLIIEALQESAIALGIEKETARILTLQTALGAARMALECDKSAATLRQQVTSPGGATEQALKVLEEGDIRKLFQQALIAAQKRAVALTQLFS